MYEFIDYVRALFFGQKLALIVSECQSNQLSG